MPEKPTVAQVRRHLLRHDWRAAESYDYGTVWRGPHGWHTVIPHWPDDDTRLLEKSTVISTIAAAAGRTLDEIGKTVADILVDDEDFYGCTRDCWSRSKPESEWVHTGRWGDCEKAVPPPPEPAHLHIPVTWIAEDNLPAAGWASVPLTLFAPWATHLPAADQHAMLAEIADAEPDTRPGIVTQWQRTAQQLADPARRVVLLGTHDPAGFVEAPRPGGDA